MLTAANRRRWLRSGTAGMCFAIVRERVGCRELSLLTWVLISGSETGEGGGGRDGEVGEEGDAGQSSIVINGSLLKKNNTILPS